MVLKMMLLRQHGCAECDRQHRIWEEVKHDAPGSVDFRDIDVEAHADAVEHYRPRMHPTIVLEVGGHEVKRWTGVTNKAVLLAEIRKHARAEQRPVARANLQSGPASGTPAIGPPGKVAMPPPERLPGPGEPLPAPPEPPGPSP